jgi:hypothetical protein
MDADVVVMAPLDGLWKHVDRNAIFQWGDRRRAGFIVLNVPKLDNLWHLVSKLDVHEASGDQQLHRALNQSHPEIVSMLPKEWDVSLANGLWSGVLADHRPDGVGHVHFNGGKESKENVFLTNKKHVASDERRSGWGLANHCIQMPWPHAKFIVESANGDSAGHQLLVRSIRGPSSDLEANNAPSVEPWRNSLCCAGAVGIPACWRSRP